MEGTYAAPARLRNPILSRSPSAIPPGDRHLPSAKVKLRTPKAGGTQALFLSVFSEAKSCTLTNIGGSQHWVATEGCKMHREPQWTYWLHSLPLGSKSSPHSVCSADLFYCASIGLQLRKIYKINKMNPLVSSICINIGQNNTDEYLLYCMILRLTYVTQYGLLKQVWQLDIHWIT